MLGKFYATFCGCAGLLAALSGCAAPASNTPAAAPAPVASSPGSVNTDNPADPKSTGVDLAVTNVSWSPPKPKVNDAVTFSATVKNKGTVATEEGIVIGVAFQINDVNVSWSDTNKTSLGPGQTRTLTANYGPSQTSTWLAEMSGEHRLAAWVDDVNRLPDTNRDNNRVEVPLPIQ